MRQQLCEGHGSNLKKNLCFFEEIGPAVLPTDNLCAAPLEQAKGLDFFPAKSAALGIVQASLALLSLARFVVGGEIVGEKLINIAELFIGKLVPALRHDEVNRDCLHIKSALSYCESTVKHSMRKRRDLMRPKIYF